MGADPAGRPVLWGLAVLVAAGLLYFLLLGQAPLSDRDEGEYAAAVAAMARTGDYAVPQLNGRPYLEKPILIFWAVAASQALFGPSELAARLPSALAALVLLALVGLLAGLGGKRRLPAVLAMAALGFSPLYVLTARMVLTDMLLTLFTTASLLCCFLAGERDQGYRRWYLAGWAALGLGFLTKGPVALAMVLPVVGVYALWRGRLFKEIARSAPHWGVLIFLAINLPWYGTAFYRLGWRFWESFFLAQNLTRFSEVLLGHGGGFFYYIPVLLLLTFPFSPAAVAALGPALRQGRAVLNAAAPDRRLSAFAALAVLVVFTVFSLAATKQINYILPALPFWALLAADYLHRLLSKSGLSPLGRGLFQGFWWGGAGLWLAAALAAPLVLYFGWDRVMSAVRFDSTEYAFPLEAPLLLLWPLAMTVCLAGMMLLFRLWRRRERPGRLILTCAAGGALFCALGLIGFWGQISGIIQGPARQMTQEMRSRLGPMADKAGMFTYGLWKPSLLYYLDRDVASLPQDRDQVLGQFLDKRQAVLVMSRVRLADRLGALPGFRELERYQGYLLGGNQAARDLWNHPTPDPPPAPGGP